MEGTHYRRVGADPRTFEDSTESVCVHLGRTLQWATLQDAAAAGVAARARKFATRVLGEPMVRGYLLSVLTELGGLLTYKARVFMPACG